MMKTADHGRADDGSAVRRFYVSRPGRVVVEGLMRPRLVVVRDVLGEKLKD